MAGDGGLTLMALFENPPRLAVPVKMEETQQLIAVA